MQEKEVIVILDFGGQYSQLIARRVRELNVYAEIVPYNISVEKILQKNPKGIILSGGPASVYEEDSPKCVKEIFELQIPILGICYGMQLMTHLLGGIVKRAEKREYGVYPVHLEKTAKIFYGLKEEGTFLMSHTDQVETLPVGFRTIGYTNSCQHAGIENYEKNLFGVQFHPEVNESLDGGKVIHQFLYVICKCKGDWKMTSFIEDSIVSLQNKIGNQKAILALSGGVDSSVVAALVSKAIGKNLTCIFVDHGLLRKKEAEEVETIFKERFNNNFIKIDARKQFLEKLKGVEDPERKRKIIGEEFIRVFEKKSQKIGKIDYLIQGTIYPDVIESGVGRGSVIKSHHNVGGLPEHISFKEIMEPLRYLLKDEVRKVGLELGLPPSLVYRQPFPGPGLAIRILGEVTSQKIAILQEADAIFREELEISGCSKNINQYFAVLTNMKSVGVMGDERTYEYVLALRAVETSDFMTGVWSHIPYDILQKVSSRIVNEVPNINRVVYDITSKPPATIEWE